MSSATGPDRAGGGPCLRCTVSAIIALAIGAGLLVLLVRAGRATVRSLR